MWEVYSLVDFNNKKIIIARYGEIHLKSGNRGYFLRELKRNLEQNTGQKVIIENSRIIINCDDESVLDKVAKTFGITSASLATRLDSKPETILQYLGGLRIEGTFKAEINRADKTFPHKSPDFAKMAGEVILQANNKAVVNVIDPQKIVYVDIREGGFCFVYDNVIKGVGGLPVGTAGRGLVMLSGGIDSPVAAWLAMKRGLSVECLHFYSPPHTNEFALEKVRKLADKLNSKMYIVNFTEIQESIFKNCNRDYMITIMRRFMVKICERFALSNRFDCIITGENLSQVASQTIQSIASNNVCATVLPILRPLVMYDKNEIIDLAKRIDTHDVSIEPHLDCCTVFIPKHPSIKPNIKKIEMEEKRLDVEGLIERALASIIM